MLLSLLVGLAVAASEAAQLWAAGASVPATARVVDTRPGQAALEAARELVHGPGTDPGTGSGPGLEDGLFRVRLASGSAGAPGTGSVGGDEPAAPATGPASVLIEIAYLAN